MARKLITERMVVEAARSSKTIAVPFDALVTPSARDKARELRVTFHFETVSPFPKPATAPAKRDFDKKVALGSDHGGFTLKEFVKKVLQDAGYHVVDVGTSSTRPVDYPDFAHAVGRLVSEGECARGIVIDGAGIGSAMAANKVPRVRAALCYDVTSAVNSREHNDANVLTLGARMIGEQVAEQIVKVWMKTEFAGGRHQARIDKITDVEKKYLK